MISVGVVIMLLILIEKGKQSKCSKTGIGKNGSWYTHEMNNYSSKCVSKSSLVTGVRG